MNEILTPKEAGLYLNVHVRTIYRLAKEAKIPGRRVGGRWRFSKAALEEWFSEDSAQRRGCSKPREPQFQRNSRPTADKADSA
jgi:excisionase family DNA binding protein